MNHQSPTINHQPSPRPTGTPAGCPSHPANQPNTAAPIGRFLASTSFANLPLATVEKTDPLPPFDSLLSLRMLSGYVWYFLVTPRAYIVSRSPTCPELSRIHATLSSRRTSPRTSPSSFPRSQLYLGNTGERVRLPGAASGHATRTFASVAHSLSLCARQACARRG